MALCPPDTCHLLVCLNDAGGAGGSQSAAQAPPTRSDLLTSGPDRSAEFVPPAQGTLPPTSQPLPGRCWRRGRGREQHSRRRSRSSLVGPPAPGQAGSSLPKPVPHTCQRKRMSHVGSLPRASTGAPVARQQPLGGWGARAASGSQVCGESPVLNLWKVGKDLSLQPSVTGEPSGA